MRGLALWAFGVASALLMVAVPICALVCRIASRRLREVTATPVMTCEQLQNAATERVVVTGRTVSRNVLRAPVSGWECIWYKVEVIEDTSKYSNDVSSEVVHAEDGGRGIEIQDGTASALLTPEIAGRKLTRGRDRVVVRSAGDLGPGPTYINDLVRNGQLDRSRRGRYTLRELIVRPDVPVAVVGSARPGADGSPVLDRCPPGSGHDGAAATTHAEVIDYLTARAARWGRWTPGLAVAGFVLAAFGLGLALGGG